LPKALEHAIIWEEEHQQYQLSTHGQLQQGFHRKEEVAFSHWVARHSSFAFVGQAGRLSVLHETRGGGTGYWYAYRTKGGHTHKRYLGSSDKVTLARLEQEARLLNTSSPPPVRASVAPSPSSEQSVIMLSARLSAPRLPLALVVRPRLFQELESISSHRLTLLCAPAGSGKTTLLSVWAASQKSAPGAASALAWLSLDALDNDLIRFWNSVIAALRKQEHLSAWVKDFGGSHRYLLDYVQQEILARLPTRLQRFLLQTSILPRMNASVCQTVTASTSELSTQEILEELEQANLFVVPLDEERQWYRYHDLFREALLVCLQASNPE
jgi:hypothetical protein